ncbi:MAG: hypothetical protein JSV61_07030 [Anaerolineales bacterium]|nr:MAG: hypothetical protein JSV61_07030 [Anaerolineales bacterium]
MNETLGFSKLLSTSKSRFAIIILLIIVLALTSFIAGKWMNSIKPPMDQMMISDGNSVVGKGMLINLEPAAELPQYEPDAIGMFVRREDNSIFIGTGINSYGVELSPDGPIAIYDGPLLEVVVAKETKIYCDDTEEPIIYNSTTKIQQKIKPGSLDELVNGSQQVQVWGRKVGDRLIADTVLYRPPWVPQRP